MSRHENLAPIFTGTVRHFIENFQPTVNSEITRWTRKARDAQFLKGCPGDCGRSSAELAAANVRIEAAHHPRSLPELIEEVLSAQFPLTGRDGWVTGSPTAMRAAIMKAHDPLEDVCQLLCTDCHRKLDLGLAARRSGGGPGGPTPAGLRPLPPRKRQIMEIIWGAGEKGVSLAQIALRIGKPGNNRLISSHISEIGDMGYVIRKTAQGFYTSTPPEGWTGPA